jgi:hypothetical protein
VPDPQDLQFERAEFPENNDVKSIKKCAICKSPLADSYYQLAGHDACPACIARFQHTNREGNHAQLLRATLFGAAGAAAGCALYGIVSLATHAEFSLIAIACGWLVARAMRKGSGGAGGRNFQIVAVLLTYAAIATHYLIPVLISIGKAEFAIHISGKTIPPELQLSALQLVESLAMSALYCLTIPFRQVASTSGILGGVIIVIGLLQAWRGMAVNKAVIAGPYSVQSS